MEGNGPMFGEAVNSGWAVAGLNPFQIDVVGARLMGFEPSKIGYLNDCLKKGLATDNFGKVKVLGKKIEECAVEFARPDNYEDQLNWDQVIKDDSDLADLETRNHSDCLLKMFNSCGI